MIVLLRHYRGGKNGGSGLAEHGSGGGVGGCLNIFGGGETG